MNTVPTPKDLECMRAAKAVSTPVAPEKIDECLRIKPGGPMERLLEGELAFGLTFGKTPLFQSALNAFRSRHRLAA